MYQTGIKLVCNILLLFLMLYALFQYQLIIYGFSQGKGQLNIVLKSKNIDDVLKDPNFPDSLKLKLELITEIKQFAIDSIGIDPNDNYSTFYNQHNQPALWVISACEPYSFKAKEWTFPIIGSVSYKGFFNESKARSTFYNLKLDGYDVDIYSPSGWSTLGWFKDPVLSSMLNRSEGQLANLIIHELTHGTLYVKNDVTFNENLANFIGDKGAEWFLQSKYGRTSKEYMYYQNNKKDEQIFKEYILKSKDRLDSLYHRLSTEKNESLKKTKKLNALSDIVRGVNNLPLNKRKTYFKFALQIFNEKNAFFMAFSRYDSQNEIFENEFKIKYRSDLRSYLLSLKQRYPSL